jgi:hypothetical protein
MDYWNYYEELPHTCSSTGSLFGNLDESRQALSALGYTSSEVDRLCSSGYLALPKYNTLIDRYYGGLLNSWNLTSRFELGRASVDEILTKRSLRQRSVPTYSAHSTAEVRQIVCGLTAPARRRLVFRGQISHYRTSRELTNPWYTSEGIGETSLLPSLCRNVLSTCQTCVPEFHRWSLLEWSSLLYRPFDIAAIDAAIVASGQHPALMTTSDLADHPNPIVSEFGNFRRTLVVGFDFNLATALNTLLQHYGLLSPVLDVTINLDVAMFFATHRLSRERDRARYSYVGSNGNASTIYVMWNDPREMEELPRDIVLQKQPALRPERQDCVVVRSGPHAMNLPAEFLLAVIKLEGEGPWDCERGVASLFPQSDEDMFLRALKSHKDAAKHLTDFS